MVDHPGDPSPVLVEYRKRKGEYECGWFSYDGRWMGKHEDHPLDLF